MESPQILGKDGPYSRGERCRECRGELIQAGEETACANCGVVAGSDPQPDVHQDAPSQASGRKLGSYVGTRLDEGSSADFNGNSTVGHVKRLSDTMGLDQAAWNCSAMIRRVADKLSLPAFVRENAVALSERMLAETKENGPGRRRRASIPAISAYALLSACRTAGMDHVSTKSVLQAYVDMGHKVTRSRLLQLGLESRVPLRPADPEALLRTVVGVLESEGAVARRLEKRGIEPGQYFRRLMQASQTIIGSLRSLQEGRNPRTLAACSVYLASREVGPKAVTQREVAETLGVAEYTVREFVGIVGREFGPLNGGGP